MKIISYSLYGDNKKYTLGAVYNAYLIKKYMPDWTARYYVNNTVPLQILDELRRANAQLIYISDTTIHGSFWRFFVADDEAVDIYEIRDTDDRISDLQASVIREFEESSCNFHMVRGIVAHRKPMMAGMWGGKVKIKNIRELINQYPQHYIFEHDEYFLNGQIYNTYFKPSEAYIHGFHHGYGYKEFKPLPENNQIGGVHEYYMIESKFYSKNFNWSDKNHL
jgi:hypothetical protein